MTTGDPTLTSTQNGNVIFTTPTFTGTYVFPDLNAKQTDLHKIENRLIEIEKRLLILHPDFEQMEKYASLKEAYEAYKIIEKLITNK